MSVGTTRPGFTSALARRLLQLELILLILCAACVPFAGRLLSVEDPLERADAIFVLAGSRVERWLEARDLFNERYAPLILLSPGQPAEIESALVRQGVNLANEAEVARDALTTLGVPADRIDILEGFPDNTADESEHLRSHALSRKWRAVIVVTSKLHTRRAALAMRRALDGAPIRIVIRSTRYDDNDPARWWQRRRTIREVMTELPKLVAYALGLGA
jgi:uncharacterized SAM-binding protein YcdF (DUF218 family)